VTSVELGIYQDDWVAAGETLELHRLLVNWIEGTRSGDANTNDTPESSSWDEYGDNNGWSTSGAYTDNSDRSATVSDTDTTATGDRWYTFNAANLVTDVQNFIDGGQSNYGWSFYVPSPSNDRWFLFQTDNGTDGYRPYLKVVYDD
jgi:hypothetical protein